MHLSMLQFEDLYSLSKVKLCFSCSYLVQKNKLLEVSNRTYTSCKNAQSVDSVSGNPGTPGSALKKDGLDLFFAL